MHGWVMNIRGYDRPSELAWPHGWFTCMKKSQQKSKTTLDFDLEWLKPNLRPKPKTPITFSFMEK